VNRLRRAFQRRERVIRHAGTMVHNGHIVLTTRGGAEAKNYDCGRFGQLPLEVIQARMQDTQGQPFVRLAVPDNAIPWEKCEGIDHTFYDGEGKQTSHESLTVDNDKRVIGQTRDGFSVTADIAEMVYNDWVLTDQIHGEGAYESVLNHDERQVLALVKTLQFDQPVNA
jgi:hypothetical protein